MHLIGKTKEEKQAMNISQIFTDQLKISSKTPTTFSELSKKEIDAARREKAKTGRVKEFKKS